MKKIEKILSIFLLSTIMLCYGMDEDSVISTEEELNEKIAAQFALNCKDDLNNKIALQFGLKSFEDPYDPLEDSYNLLDQSKIIELLRQELNEAHEKLHEAQKSLERNKQKLPLKYRKLRKIRSNENFSNATFNSNGDT